MPSLRDAVHLETTAGEPVSWQGATIRPQSQALSLRLPEVGGFVWSRPVAVLVERGGQTQRLPIFNMNRWLNVGLGLVVAAAIAMLIVSNSSKEACGR